MCVMSMIGDHYYDKWRDRDWFWQAQQVISPQVSRSEFEQLKAEVAELKELLKRAKKYDEDNGEPDCEIEEKMALLRKVAKLVGVDLDEALQSEPQT